MRKHICFLTLTALASLSGCGSATTSSTGPTQNPPPSITKSAKRGVAYDLASPADLAALSPGVSWWYNWSPQPNAAVPADYATRYSMDFYPMLWNGNFNAGDIVTYLKANPGIKYMLVLNEPNLVSQANLTPQQAAQLWPSYEAVAAQTGVKTWGQPSPGARCRTTRTRCNGSTLFTPLIRRPMATAIRRSITWLSTGTTTG